MNKEEMTLELDKLLVEYDNAEDKLPIMIKLGELKMKDKILFIEIAQNSMEFEKRSESIRDSLLDDDFSEKYRDKMKELFPEKEE